MKKCIYITLMIWLALLSILFAQRNSDTFMLGAYSEMRSHQSPAYNDSLASHLRMAGFNATRGIAVYQSSPDLVSNMASNIYNSYGLDLILEDYIFNPSLLDNNNYGYAALAAGNFQRYEAEYDTHLPVNTTNVGAGGIKDEHHYYKSIDRVGLKVQDNLYHNNYYWHVPCDSVGYAYKDLYLRWGINNVRLRDEFRFLRSGAFGTNGNDTLKLNVRFVFKVNDDPEDPLESTEIIARFHFPCFPKDNASVENITFSYNNSSPITNYFLTKAEYDNLPSAGIDADSSIKQITFRIDIVNSSATLMEIDGWFKKLTNLNPRMYWHGRGSLNLDCIEFFDDIFAQYTNNQNVRAKLRNFENVPNLFHFYGVEEPKSPLFASAKILEEHLNGSSRHFVTALNRINYSRNNGTVYRNTMAYCDIVNPRTIMINRYPFLGGEYNWSIGDVTEPTSVQSRINLVTNEYKYYREALDETVAIVMIPQIYGEYDESDHE